VVAGGIGLLALSGVRLARTPDPLRSAGLGLPPWRTWLLAVAAGLGVRALTLGPLAPLSHGPALAGVRDALAAALHPGWAGPIAVVLSIGAQEVLFRGWMRQRAGDVASAVLFAVVVAPFDPLAGLLLGVVLATVAREAGGSILPGLLARGLAAYAFVGQPDLLGPFAAPVALALVAALGWGLRPSAGAAVPEPA
jgi:hypothetical protein